MCLGVPMQVLRVEGTTARCAARGIERDVSLFLLRHEPVAPGDWVVVHVGYAIQRIGEAEARTAWALREAGGAGEGGDA